MWKFLCDPRFLWSLAAGMAVLVSLPCVPAVAQDRPATDMRTGAANGSAENSLDLRELIRAGGVIGYVIVALSVAMVALIVEHLLSIRRNSMMPPELDDEVNRLINEGRFQQCRMNPSFLGRLLSAGIAEVGLGYTSIQKAMEDAAVEQSARLLRKIEYLSVIGTIAPMLGLLGTVWGMILAFNEFQTNPVPQTADLAPGISRALVTTLLGLGVAVPAFASHAFFRNRIDELVAETSLLAEHVFSDYKRRIHQQESGALRAKRPRRTPTSTPTSTPASAPAAEAEP